MGKAKVGTLRMIIVWGAIDATACRRQQLVQRRPDRARGGPERDRGPAVHLRHPGVGREGPRQPELQRRQHVLHLRAEAAAALAAWKTFVGEAVDRYGPAARSGRRTPSIPEVPIETWQIWNEQNSKTFYAPKPKPKGYAKLLSAAADATAQADASAESCSAGWPSSPARARRSPARSTSTDLYDVERRQGRLRRRRAAPVRRDDRQGRRQVEKYRKVMKKAGDSRGSMYVTEIGAGSANGGNSLNRGTDGPGEAADGHLQVLPQEAQLVQRRDGRLVQLAGRRSSICSWCKTSGLLKHERQGEALLQGVREADRRQRKR